MIKLKQILLESPNKVFFGKGITLQYDDDDTITFAYSLKFKKFRSSTIMIHLDMSDEFSRYQGRYWKRKQLLSFWEYPTEKSIIFELINQLKINPKSTKIEVIYNNDNVFQYKEYDIEKATLDLEDVMNRYIGADEIDYYNDFINLEEYIGKYCT